MRDVKVPNYTAPFKAIEADFHARGIPTGQPGFYDHEAFARIERDHPEYLNNYARFVQTRPYSAEYRERAKSVVTIVAEILHEELVRDGRLGACIDLSMAASRILDREGIWNYLVKGALTLRFSPAMRIPALYYWPVDDNEAKAGHVWIATPPYDVIDLTIGQQPDRFGEAKHMPAYVLETEREPAEPGPDDIFSDAVRRQARQEGIPKDRLLSVVTPWLPRFMRTFPSNTVRRGGVSMTYIPVAISASDKPLEEIRSLKLGSKYGIQVYEERIRPRLVEALGGTTEEAEGQ